jgi:hypothetical protein
VTYRLPTTIRTTSPILKKGVDYTCDNTQLQEAPRNRVPVLLGSTVRAGLARSVASRDWY